MQLTDNITSLPFVGDVAQKRLEKLGIITIEDLLTHIPHRYIDYPSVSAFPKLHPDQTVSIMGTIGFIKNQYTKTGKQMQLVQVVSGEHTVLCVWFNQPFLVQTFRADGQFSFSGKTGWFGREVALISPDYEKVPENGVLIHTGRLLPVYPETAGISSKWLRRRIADVLESDITVEDSITWEISKKNAISKIHFPESLEDTESGRRHLAFEELFVLQAGTIARKGKWHSKKSISLPLTDKTKQSFIKNLPFELTNAQISASSQILSDLANQIPMNRLLQGDVGSGKTVVAALACLAAFENGKKAVFMAPTQILAAQHYETLEKLFSKINVRISLTTAAQKVLPIGSSDILVGTHSLLHSHKEVSESGVIIIDEQHRFGVGQRAHLESLAQKRGYVPHILTMSATPIPRTIALTLYGDLDLSILDELPRGRQKITTWIVPQEKRKSAYAWIQKEILTNKTQAFVICPLIDESESETLKEVKAASQEFQTLQKQFKKLKFGLLHGRIKAGEKTRILKDFKDKKFDVLVATPVVEVGIDIPNATIIVIEAAERFGLAQLHQLRGRVGRGDKKSYCLLFTESKEEKTAKRLVALTKSQSGFELSEIDLSLRGPGEIFGTKQSGLPELKIARWQDVELIKSAKELANEVLSKPTIYPREIDLLKRKQVGDN